MDKASHRFGTGAAALLACLLCPCAPAHAEISSFAFVQEDGSLRISGQVVRLYGIYIPKTEESCYTFIRPPTCGPRAKLALEFKIGGNFIHCTERAVNPDYSVTASCTLEDQDLSEWMLQQGWAVALSDAPFEYGVMENMARARGVGIWGIPVEPFRRFRR
jgi:endonuclease YncB( thermonuclease family)